MAAQGVGRRGSCGLGEIDIIAVTTGTYGVQCRLLLPTQIQSGSASAVVTVIKVNSTTKYTSAAGDLGVDIQVAATAGDTIKIITSSAQANDNANNAVRLDWAVSAGEAL